MRPRVDRPLPVANRIQRARLFVPQAARYSRFENERGRWRRGFVRRPDRFATPWRGARPGRWPSLSPPQRAASRPRLLDRVRDALRARHSSRRTEKSYVAWIRRYIVFHGKRHPAEMGAVEVTQFLSSLAQQVPRRGLDAEPSTERPAVSLPSGPPGRDALA